ncbi:MAG: AAA family ATPase [Flavobacteriales bacterium]|nr:AAA family ATPase [Flavobacteriales bacterium]
MKQEQALAFLKSGKNTFLTGSAGTGKTYVLNQYISYLKERKVPVAVTASTGIAATHINGMTIHAWAGIGIKDHLTSAQLRTLKTKKYLEKKLDKVEVLIIDEISMLHQKQLDLVDQVLKYFKMNQLAFGGIQVIFCGDFFQLPPVGNSEESSKRKFAFMSPMWVNAAPTICYLTQQYRQSNDDLNTILNEIRSGRISEMRYLNLKDTIGQKIKSKIEPTKLFTHNYDVDKINQEELKKISGKSKHYNAETKGNEKLLEGLKKSVLALESMELKIGAKVMFVRNIPEKGVVNGSLGEIVDFDEEENHPLVRVSDDRLVIASPEDWKIQDETGKVLAQFNQVPLRLAWAITIHKSQGMTLDAAEIDLSNTFERGQGYVALSRLKRLENLSLLGLNEMALQVDPLAFKADKRFQELSGKAEQAFDTQQLEQEARKFIKDCGGLSNEKEILKQKGKIKKKEHKETTYDQTYQLTKQNLSITEIAKERGMAEGTIASHIIKLKKDYPEANLSSYKPQSSLMNKVEIEYMKRPKNEPLSTKTIYENLNGEVSYVNIKLALAFII